jgi:diguanylate cyclase (GGDEF)-like protein
MLVGFGLLAMALSDSTYTWLTAKGTYATGNPVDVGWIVAYLLLGLAAVSPGTVDDAVAAPSAAAVQPLTRILLPYGVLSAAFVVTIISVATAGGDDPFLLGTAALLGALVVARQLVALLDNRRLTAHLQDKIAELGERERQLAHLAFHDPLTRLANRSLFLERVREAVAQRANNPRPLAVLFIDLDDFKTVNDSLGHDAGDRLLEEAATRIAACLGPGDLAARLGGDEFGVLLQHPGEPTRTSEGLGDEQPAMLASRVHDRLRRPVVIADHHLLIRASIGIAHSAAGAESAEELLL